MSGPETPSPNRPTEAGSPRDPHSNPADPLLDSDSFIDQGRTDDAEADTPDNTQDDEARKVEFGPGVVIAAEPISVFIPGDNSAEAAPSRSGGARRRNPEEMAKRPSWLPEDWKIDLRVRSSGASAGLIDRYYVEPTGQRKFRSKNEVLHFLETGSKLKRKSTDTDATSSGGASSQKQKNSNSKSKKSEGLNPDATPNSKRKKLSEAAVNSDKMPNAKGKKSKEARNQDSLNSVRTEDSPRET